MKAFVTGLGDQQSVERVTMMMSKRLNRQDMRHGDR
jgi:hypothetical protein